MSFLLLRRMVQKLEPRGPRVVIVVILAVVCGRLTVAIVDRFPLTDAGADDYGYADFLSWLAANAAVGISTVVVALIAYNGFYALASRVRGPATRRGP